MHSKAISSALLFSILALSPRSQAEKFDCASLKIRPVLEQTFSLTPSGDFAFRDSLPQTEKLSSQWGACCGSYGPCALPYPKVVFPNGVDNLTWSRFRVVEAAKRLIGLPYRHHHIPAMGGLDCSNFTAFVYNYALGIRFTSWVERQAAEVGRRLRATEKLMPGDLIFLYNSDRTGISHALIYVNPREIIDSTGKGVAIRPFEGWYRDNYAWARRVIEGHFSKFEPFLGDHEILLTSIEIDSPDSKTGVQFINEAYQSLNRSFLILCICSKWRTI